MMKNLGMTEDKYNLIVESLPMFELDVFNGVILNRNINSLCNGYLQLGINGKKVYQHQIFAVVRYGRKCIGMTVNHINEIKTDNSWGNLELLSVSDNTRARKVKTCGHDITPIKAINIDTGEEMMFESRGEASRQLRLDGASIFQALDGKRKRVGRYTFQRMAA